MQRIEDCISFLLQKAAQRVARRARELLAEYDVTPVQYATLCVLWEQNAQTGTEIGTRLTIDSATMTGIIDRLERAGLIERQPDDSDRRIYRLYVTERGRRLRNPLDAAMDRLNCEFSELVGSESETFYRLLRELGDAGRAFAISTL